MKSTSSNEELVLRFLNNEKVRNWDSEVIQFSQKGRSISWFDPEVESVSQLLS